MEIEANQKKVFGEGRSYQNNAVHKFSFTGAFKNERFLKLEYQNKDSNVVNFGTIILELSSTGKSLNGRYVGHGHINERILDGEILVDKS